MQRLVNFFSKRPREPSPTVAVTRSLSTSDDDGPSAQKQPSTTGIGFFHHNGKRSDLVRVDEDGVFFSVHHGQPVIPNPGCRSLFHRLPTEALGYSRLFPLCSQWSENLYIFINTEELVEIQPVGHRMLKLTTRMSALPLDKSHCREHWVEKGAWVEGVWYDQRRSLESLLGPKLC